MGETGDDGRVRRLLTTAQDQQQDTGRRLGAIDEAIEEAFLESELEPLTTIVKVARSVQQETQGELRERARMLAGRATYELWPLQARAMRHQDG